MTTKKLHLIEKTYIGILLVIFGGIVLHAPLSVGLGTLFPNYSLMIKSWKEVLMLAAGLVVLYLLYRTKQMKLLRDPIILAIGSYATLHLVLLLYSYQGLTASLAGLAIDLRFMFFFALVYIAMSLYPNYRKRFIQVGVIGALVVLTFAMLQVFILPADILKYLGYNIHTISPYLTVDQNHAFTRINSTFRGPNPLGAYAGVVLTLVTSAIAKRKVVKDKWPKAIAVILFVGSIVTLWASYSRSALIGTFAAVGIVLVVAVYRKISTKTWISIGLMVLVLVGGLVVARNNSFISNVFLHENPANVDNISSNAGHIDSLNQGVKQMTRLPLGGGIGSTGSASILSGKTEIIENQYLFTAHEAGWLGLIYFVSIYAAILLKLWILRKDWFALGVFASGISIAIVCLFLPILVDDTLAIVWWGMAAVAAGGSGLGNGKWDKGLGRSRKGIIE